MAKNIADLITELRGTRTYKELSEDCGGLPSTARISSMVKNPMNSFPSPETIRGLAKGLGVTELDIVTSCGVSMTLWDDDNTHMPISLPHGAEKLTRSQKNVIVSVVREFMTANQGS